MTSKKSDILTLKEIIEIVSGYLPKFDERNFEKAYKFAEKAHRGQRRKEGSPYITHPLATAEILAGLHVDEDTLIAALLHDVPEDTEKTLEDVQNNFGKNVTFLVDGITKLSKVYYRHDMAERQIESLKKLLIHSAKDPRAILIKLADRLHNMRTLEFVREDKRLRIAKETMEIYVPIANLFGIKEIRNELEDLCFQYLHPEKYKEILHKVEDSKIKLDDFLNQTIALIQGELLKQKVRAVIYGRHRNLYTIFKKLKTAGGEISKITDVLAIRIIVKNKPHCYKSLGVVHDLFKPKVGFFKDYIAVPKPNGYQSLHTIVFGIKGVSTEVQIRTEAMHREAEYGILSSYLSPQRGKVLKLDKDKRAKWVDQILEMQKAERSSKDFIEELKQDIFEDRIFVFTPKGDSIDLPKGATCIDFAYTIHTDVGHKALHAEINHKSSPLTQVLKSGDTVKIVTSKRRKEPDWSWLNFVKTNIAKDRIKKYLGSESRDKRLKRGKNILQTEFDRAGLGLIKDMNFKKAQESMRVRQKKFFSTKEDLLISIGSGGLTPISVIRALLSANKKPTKSYRFSDYEGTSKRPARVGIKITCHDRIGLLRDISDIIAKFTLNIKKMKAYVAPFTKEPVIEIFFDVESFAKLSKILRHIEQIDGVISIMRLFVKRQVTFMAISILTLLMWVFHPFLMRYILNPEITSHIVLHSVALYFGFLMLFLAIFSLKNLTKKSFPQFRETLHLWRLTLVILLLAITTVVAEVYFLNLYRQDWPVILLLIVSVCIYLATEYFNYSKEKKG
jgi:GTP diphosphokinase / guanosine-3',5'-bis(diphosphate) 3'-diphosphatase